MPLVKSEANPSTILEYNGRLGSLAIVTKTDKGYVSEAYGGGVEGVVQRLNFREHEHNGENIQTVSVLLKDSDNERFIVNFNPNTIYGAKFLGKLNAADLTQPVRIRGGLTKEGTQLGEYTATKDTPWMSVSQNGAPMKEDYGNGVTSLPESREVKLNGKVIRDNTAAFEVAANVFEMINRRLGVNPADNQADSGEAADIPRA